MRSPDQLEPAVGWRSREVEAELPGLRLLLNEVEVARTQALTGDSPHDVQARLRELSSRFRGARAVGLRREPIPAAYRVFFRQIGMDPDVQRTPIEAAVLERMLRGGFPTGGLLEDVLAIALLDTSVPVYALDATALSGPLGIRAASDGESLGTGANAPLLSAGRLVVADGASAVAVLLGQCAPSHVPHKSTRCVQLLAVQVDGVPTLYVEEALWTCRHALMQP